MALIQRTDDRWRLEAVSPSYDMFVGGAEQSNADDRPCGSLPQISKLLAAAEQIGGGEIDLVAVDMPLALGTVRARRAADDAVSRAYGARKCGTHSPNEARPGPISDLLRDDFLARGFPLKTQAITAPCLIEVYPHPALVELAGAAERLRYKQSKRRTYWPYGDRETRLRALFETWVSIVGLLDREIDGVAARLPLPASTGPTWRLKAFEDALDAVVCAWVGACALQDLCAPYGDQTAAIWIPRVDAKLRAPCSSGAQ